MNTPPCKSTRVEYLDVVKGILMVLLVFAHLIVYAKHMNYSNECTGVIQNIVPFFRCFFMQSFFIITGLCTSWYIPFTQFLIRNAKTLLLPALIFSPIAILTSWIYGDALSINWCANYFFNHFVLDFPWFLAALFISKCCYYFIRKFVASVFVRGVAVFGLFAVGLFMRESGIVPNIWSIQQALLLTVFLYIGDFFKGENMKFFADKYLALASIPYFGLIVLWQVMGLKFGFPAIDYFVDIHYKTAPFFLVWSTSGSALIILIAKHIPNTDFVKQYGTQSLFVYLAHPVFVCGFMWVLTTCFNLSTTIIGGGGLFIH